MPLTRTVRRILPPCAACLYLAAVAPNRALAGFSVTASTSGNGGTPGYASTSGDEANRGYVARATSQFDGLRPGPTGGPTGATGSNFTAIAYGTAGGGYLRAYAATDVTAGHLDYPNTGNAIAMATAHAVHNDITFSSARGDEAPISTTLRVSFDGSTAAHIAPYGPTALDPYHDRAYGNLSVSIGFRDIADPYSDGVWTSGDWAWTYSRRLGTDIFEYEGSGTGALANWGGNGQVNLTLPIEALSGHVYQLSMYLSVDARAETDGDAQGLSLAALNHTLKLADVPFDLPPDANVNSADARITDGTFAGAPPVPEPAVASLTALAPLPLLRRKR
jgi:hypothetical protein